MKMQYDRYDGGGRGPGDGNPEEEESDILDQIKRLFGRMGSPVGDAMMGVLDKINNARDKKEALEEFNRVADMMPTAAGQDMGPSRKDLPPMRMLDPKGVQNLPSVVGRKAELKPMSDRPIVGEDANNRRMLFDRLRRR